MRRRLNSEVIRVGIIGSGYGGRIVLPCASFVKGIKVTSWASRFPEKIKADVECYGVPRVFESWESLVESDEADLICVASPPFLHHEMVMKILSAGKHLLCEKPVALNAIQTQEIVLKARASSSLAMVDHQLRFHPNFQKIRAVISGKALGPIHHVDVIYQTGARRDPALPWDWWADVRCGGGELNALGSHFVDILRWLLGEIESVNGYLKTCVKQREAFPENRWRRVTADDYAAFHLIFESGAFAAVSLSAMSIGEPFLELRVVGEKGILILEGFNRLRLKIGQNSWVDISESDPLISRPVIGVNPWRTSLVRLLEHFALCIREGKAVEGATLEDGHETQKVLDVIRSSFKNGRWGSLKKLFPVARRDQVSA